MGLQDRVANLEGRVAKLDTRCEAAEDAMARHLDDFGGYKNRTASELADIRSQLRPIVATLEAMVDAAESRADVERAASLLRRARNNLTRVGRAAAAATP